MHLFYISLLFAHSNKDTYRHIQCSLHWGKKHIKVVIDVEEEICNIFECHSILIGISNIYRHTQLYHFKVIGINEKMEQECQIINT